MIHHVLIGVVRHLFRLHILPLGLEGLHRERVLLGPLHPELGSKLLELLDVPLLQADDLDALRLVLGNGLDVGLLDRRVMIHRMPGHGHLEQILEVLGDLLPGVHVDLDAHQVDRLVQAGCGGRTHDDVLGDLGEPQVVVDRPADEVGGVDDALLQGRIDLPAGKQDRGDAGRAVNFGDHPARVTDLLSLKVLEGADGDLGVDQVVVVLDGTQVHHVVGAVSLTGDLLPAEGGIPGIPLIRTVQGEGVGGEEGRHWSLARPVDVETVHGVEHPGFDRIEHLEGPDDRAGGQAFDQQLALGDFAHLFAELLELGVTDGSGIPGGLHLHLDGALRVEAHYARETHHPRGGAGRHRCALQETTT